RRAARVGGRRAARGAGHRARDRHDHVPERRRIRPAVRGRPGVGGSRRIRGAVRAAGGRGAPRTLPGRGLPGPSRPHVRVDLPARGVPASVRVDRPAPRGPGRGARAGHAGRGGHGHAGADRADPRAARVAGRPRRAGRAPLDLRPRRVPERDRRVRARAAARAGHGAGRGGGVMPAANERPSLLGRPTVPSEQSTGAGAAPAAAWPADPGLPGGVLPAGSLADAPPASSPAGLPSARPNGAAPAAPQAATRAVRAAIATDPGHGAVVPPLHLSATFAFAGFGLKGAYDYTRSGNPTRDQLAAAIAEL